MNPDFAFKPARLVRALLFPALLTPAAFAQDVTQANPAPDETARQAVPATPPSFRFEGAMASVWTQQMVESITQDAHLTIPMMVHPPEPFDEGTYVWDAWPIRLPDGSIAEFDGWVVMIGLSAEWQEVEDTGRAFYTLSELRYWYSRDGAWRPGGTVFTAEEGLGTRQWAGSTLYDPETQRVTFFYTAVGSPDAPSLETDPPPRQVSIFNEAIGRPSTVQRLASATATLSVTEQGVAFDNVGEHRILAEADGFWYDTYETYLAQEAVYGFRDPEYWRDPRTGAEHILFTANAGGQKGPYNGVIGLMTKEGEDWVLEPPILLSEGVNSQLERPHVVTRDDGLYLFFSTHDFTFSPQHRGPRGLYGFRSASGDLKGLLKPVNGHGLVAANPVTAPEQVYSFYVLPDGKVMSYLNILWGFDKRPEYEDREMWGGPAPMFGLSFDADTVVVAQTDADAAP